MRLQHRSQFPQLIVIGIQPKFVGPSHVANHQNYTTGKEGSGFLCQLKQAVPSA
jgi:hypothetical protein